MKLNRNMQTKIERGRGGGGGRSDKKIIKENRKQMIWGMSIELFQF